MNNSGEQLRISPPEADVLGIGRVAIVSDIPDINMYHESSTIGSDSLDYIKISPNYDRDLAEYERLLSTTKYPFRIRDWKRKTILDIGSGAYDRFGLEARAKGVNVVSLNPALKEERHREFLDQSLEKAKVDKRDKYGIFYYFIRKPKKLSVSGLGQRLPFKSEIFEAIVSVYGVPYYLHHVDEEYGPATRAKDKLLIYEAFKEIIRVLKPGGKAFFRDRHQLSSNPDSYAKRMCFSESDGTEVREILDELAVDGIDSEIFEDRFTGDRVIIITKTKN